MWEELRETNCDRNKVFSTLIKSYSNPARNVNINNWFLCNIPEATVDFSPLPSPSKPGWETKITNLIWKDFFPTLRFIFITTAAQFSWTGLEDSSPPWAENQSAYSKTAEWLVEPSLLSGSELWHYQPFPQQLEMGMGTVWTITGKGGATSFLGF